MTDPGKDEAAHILAGRLWQIKQLHGMKQDGVCITCGMNWPCDAIRLLGVVEELVKAHEKIRDNSAPCCGYECADISKEALARAEERLSR